MGEAALKIVDEAAGEEAASQTVQLTVIEGGAATAEAGSVTAAAGAGAAAGVTEAGGAAAAAGIGGAVGAGEATAGVGAAAGISGVAAATAGVAAVAVGLGALGYYLYKHKSPENPRLAIPCPSQQTLAPTEGVIQLRCDDGWDDCQKRQAREKVRRLDELAKRNNGLKRRRTAGYVRDLGNTWAAKYRSDFDRIAEGRPKSRLGFTHPNTSGPTGNEGDFMDDCLYQKWVSGGRKSSDSSPLDECSPDHVQDLQWGGHVQGQLTWLDREVNEKLGRDMSAGKNDEIDVAKGFELKCP